MNNETTTSEQALEVAKIIAAQIGVPTMWELGVKERVFSTEKLGGLVLVLGGASETRGKRVKIVLDYNDTYEVEVFKMRKTEKTGVKAADGVYCDSLPDTIRALVFGGAR